MKQGTIAKLQYEGRTYNIVHLSYFKIFCTTILFQFSRSPLPKKTIPKGKKERSHFVLDVNNINLQEDKSKSLIQTLK